MSKRYITSLENNTSTLSGNIFFDSNIASNDGNRVKVRLNNINYEENINNDIYLVITEKGYDNTKHPLTRTRSDSTYNTKINSDQRI